MSVILFMLVNLILIIINNATKAYKYWLIALEYLII